VPNLKIEVVENASTACKCMIMWISGSYSFYHVNRRVKPKKAALAAAETEVKGLSAKLAEKQKSLKVAVDKVEALNAELESTIRYKERLEKEYDECSKQLERAVKLIESLGGEKGRWGELAKELKVAYQSLTGDILVSAGEIAYLGAFTAAFRSAIVE
jgi:dynein heavy chain, axonemal